MNQLNQIFISDDIKSKVKLNASKKYRIIGDKIVVNMGKFKNGNDKFKNLGIHHIGPDGILCDDLETYITWDKF